jgi:hypothetical protein
MNHAWIWKILSLWIAAAAAAATMTPWPSGKIRGVGICCIWACSSLEDFCYKDSSTRIRPILANYVTPRAQTLVEGSSSFTSFLEFVDEDKRKEKSSDTERESQDCIYC